MNVTELEDQLRGSEKHPPLKFYMDRLLRDPDMRRELLYRLRDIVSDTDIKSLIDKCLEGVQTEVESQKERRRLDSHHRMLQLSERMDEAILKIEQERRKN